MAQQPKEMKILLSERESQGLRGYLPGDGQQPKYVFFAQTTPIALPQISTHYTSNYVLKIYLPF